MCYKKNIQYAQIETILHGDKETMTDAQKRANAKYKARNRENITLEAPKGYNDKIKQLSILAGKSKARYIMDAIAAQAQRDGHADILAAGSDRDGDGETETETDGSAEEDRE